MDDATQGLNELLSFSTEMNVEVFDIASSLAAAFLGVALIFVVWELATKKKNASSYLISWGICLIFTILFII